MDQLSLFETEHAVTEPRAPNAAYIRKHLNRLLRLARQAERLPWSQAETASWEKLFPELTLLLPPEEGEALRAAFVLELERLKAA
ncbi:hypothetical protein [Mesorhizobium sp. M0323]|uniref:hypothetical protein n=1 Tax=unclassified Mesorhizobium TaxID=325217 RepID=UPI00333D9E14